MPPHCNMSRGHESVLTGQPGHLPLELSGSSVQVRGLTGQSDRWDTCLERTGRAITDAAAERRALEGGASAVWPPRDSRRPEPVRAVAFCCVKAIGTLRALP